MMTSWRPSPPHLRDALFYALRCLAWPSSPDLGEWQSDTYMARLSAATMAESIEHPRRLTGVRVPVLYASARRRLDQEHRNARALDPQAPEARPPQSLPETCTLTLRQLLDPDGDLAMLIAMP
jgi:hypothetical protein